MTNSSWYTIAKPTDPLNQGDLVFECQIIQPTTEATSEGQELKGDAFEDDVIILSQSCDIIQKKIDLVLVCPFYTLTELKKNHTEYNDPNLCEKIRQGHVIGYHLLNKLQDQQDYLIVDFKNVYAVPLDFLSTLAKIKNNRPRLLSPYRENLSQSFARFIMRVGLPEDIPRFN